jgi:hypothetical protein
VGRVNRLYVAAGGGGDALAALIVRRARGEGPGPVVATLSWDRYVLDPAPGPRTLGDFSGLKHHSANAWEVTRSSSLRSGARSTLTLGAQTTDARWFLLDPAAGVVGLRTQLTEILAATRTDAITLVDVGGDVIAHGDENSLRSPLADSLTLAAVARLAATSDVVIAGPGLDGELPAQLVGRRCADAHGVQLLLRPEDVEPYLDALRQHPSEATSLLAAAIAGMRGRAEIRDGGVLFDLNEQSAATWVVPTPEVISANKLAQALGNTQSLGDAERITQAFCGRNELTYERRKARSARRDRPERLNDEELSERLDQFLSAARERGADLTTYRRITDAIGSRSYEPERLRALLGNRSLDRLAVAML